MVKREFIDELCKRIRLMPAEDAQKIVMFYSEMIDDRIEDGMSEEDAVASLGSVDDIVREITEPADGGHDSADDSGEYGAARVECGRVYSYRQGNIEELSVYDSGTNVTVKLSRDDMIHLCCTGMSEGWYEVSVGQIMTVKKVTKSEFSVLGVSVTLPFGNSQGELTIELPEEMLQRLMLSVNTGSGDIKVSLPKLKSLHAKSASGDVVVNELRESKGVTANTASGDIKANGVMCEKLSCGTASGDVEVKEFGGVGLALNTASGDIDAKRFSCSRLQLSTASGDSNIEGSATERADAKSVSGDMRITLCSATRNIVLESVSGSIEAEVDAKSDDYAITLRSTSGRLRSPSGNPVGNRSVRGKTISGSIDVTFKED